MPQLVQSLPQRISPASAEAERALPLLNSMQTFPATYKGGRVVELSKDIALPKDINVLVVVLKQDDETVLRRQLQSAAETVFAKLWDNEADEVWNEYL